MENEQAKFIVIEGLDGTGKTTQIKRLAANLKQQGRAVFTDAEPTSAPTGKLLRQILSGEIKSDEWATAALFFADRVRHNTDENNGIKKHLANGETVLLDRYYFSTFAYQGANTDANWTMDLHYGCPQITRPDLVLFLTMSPEKCLARIRAGRSENDIEIYENPEALTKVSDRFDTVFSLVKEKENVVYIDADGTPDEVFARISAAVDTLWK